MLYSLGWLQTGKSFPPSKERTRIERYEQNAALFNGEHFEISSLRTRGDCEHKVAYSMEVYNKSASRISRVVGNFEDVISFPILLNYQRLMALKMADLVCGEYPTITGTSPEENKSLTMIRDYTEFDSRLFAGVIDLSRFGDSVWRVYRDEEGNNSYTNWDPREWFPIVAQDGTMRITHHVLCWIENTTPDEDIPHYQLHAQIHGTSKEDAGHYEHRIYKMDKWGGTIGRHVSTEMVQTGLSRCAVFNVKQFSTSTTVFGYDDYVQLDSILAEIMARVGQISIILDKHSDPNIAGPVSMLQQDPMTGEFKLKLGKFFGVSEGEMLPQYMTWDGQLEAAFKQLELLINQLYILSEMGNALLGATDGGQAVSGTAMRYKMVNPLAKARRIANNLTVPVRQLFATLSEHFNGASAVPFENISVFWSDGLPDDPRENIELVKLATGQTSMMPLETAIVEYFKRSNDEARQWIKMLAKEKLDRATVDQAILQMSTPQEEEDPNKPGPQDGKGVNPQKKGSTTGMNNFGGLNNQHPTKDDKS